MATPIKQISLYKLTEEFNLEIETLQLSPAGGTATFYRLIHEDTHEDTQEATQLANTREELLELLKAIEDVVS